MINLIVNRKRNLLCCSIDREFLPENILLLLNVFVEWRKKNVLKEKWIFSSDPLPEKVPGQKEGRSPDQGEPPIFGDQDPGCGPLEKDLPENDQKIPERVDERQILDQVRHVCDRGGKTGQDDRRNQEKERSQKSLLLGRNNRRNHEPHSQTGQREKEDPEVKGEKRSPQRDVEEKHRHQNDGGRFKKSDHEAGQDFSQDDIHRTKRGDQELVERSVLPLPGDGQGGDQKRDHERQKPHDAGNDEPPALEVRVVPGPDFEGGDGRRQTVSGHEVVVVVGNDGLDVSHEDHRRIALASVEQGLHPTRLACKEVAAEGAPDMQHQKDFPVVDQTPDLFFGPDLPGQTKVGRPRKAGQKLSGIQPRIFVPDGIGNMVQVEGRRIAEHDQLDEGRDDQDHPGFFVPEKRQELFLGQSQDPDQKGFHRILFRLIRTSRVKRKREKRKSAAALGRITPGMSPAKKIDCRMVTK